MRALEKPRPSRNFGKSISTRRTRSSTGPRRRTSSPASIRTELAFDWSRKASRLTAGSSGTGSSRKRRVLPSLVACGMGLPLSAIDRLLESFHADAAASVEEPLAGLAHLAVALHRPLDCIDDAVFIEAGAGDLGLAGCLVARTAEQELVVLGALTVDAENADVAGVVVTAGVDAAADLDLQLTEIALPLGIGEAIGDLLGHRNRARVGQRAIIEARAGDDVGDQVEVGIGKAGVAQRLPHGVEIGLADVRQDQVLSMRHAQLVEAVAFGQVGHDVHLIGGNVAADALDRLQADVDDRIARRLVRGDLLVD